MKPMVHYLVCKVSPLVPVLSQLHPVNTFPCYFPKIYTNIIFPCMPRSSRWSLSFQFSTQSILCISHLPCMLHGPPSHLQSDHPSNIWQSVQVMKFLIMLSSPAFCHFCLRSSTQFSYTIFP